MANTKTAKENIKINRRNNKRNRSYKSSLKTALVKADAAIQDDHDHNTTTSVQPVRYALRLLDKLVTKGVLKKKTVARKKSKLAKRAHSL